MCGGTNDQSKTRRTLLRQVAVAGGAITGIGTAPIGATEESQQTAENRTEGSAQKLYTCDITTEADPTPDVNDRLRVERIEGTFGPTKPACFEEQTLLYRYLFTVFKGEEPRGRQGIAFAPQKRLPRGVYRIANIFTCAQAPSGFCAVKPFYGVIVRRVDA
ncbi:hypothetical protein [Haladaptatus sp. DFWS20]|uniref:hypothetical protein n=1 Tax=Haladaptatus sp. DFWS20 TaxID=3403467 RepID=UPI003EB93FDF